jgi:hypothetical protein
MAAYRDGLTLTMRQYGLFNQPLVATLDAQRTAGRQLLGRSRPFLTISNTWYAGGMHDNSYRACSDGWAHTCRPSRGTSGRPASRATPARGGAMIGRGTYEKSRPATDGVIVSDSGVLAPDTSPLENRYQPYQTFRAGLAGGLRWLNYMHVQGFDALLGEQDVGRGFQVAATVERGLSAFGATDKSSLVSLDVYTGAGTPKSFVGLAARGEELPAGGGDSWSAAVLSGRMAWYLRPSERRTIEASFEFAGGWRERLPLQLSLGDKASGFRGYNGAVIPGGQRFRC